MTPFSLGILCELLPGIDWARVSAVQVNRYSKKHETVNNSIKKVVDRFYLCAIG
jgi:hypothetical protein